MVGRRAADGAGQAVGVVGFDVLAAPAQADGDGWAEGVGSVNDMRARGPVVRDSNGGVDCSFFDRLGTWSEHADGKFKIAVDDMAWRPALWSLVVQVARAGRKAKHREDSVVRESFAEVVLDERLVRCGFVTA